MAVGSPTVFISYKRGHDSSLAFVAELEAALHGRAFQVWRDVGIEAGDRWPDELYRWLMECSAAVVVLSDEAAASEWCRREWSVLAARAARADLRVIPVRVEKTEVPDIFSDRQTVTAAPHAIDTVLRLLDNVAAAPPSRADYLAAHQAWLRWQFREAKVLGREPYSLADVYVETECGTLTWDELERDRIDPFAEDQGGRASLIDTVLDRFADPRFREVVVVQGPAGSGKSAFALCLADRLVEEGLTPVVIRFRDLRLGAYAAVDEMLQDAVRLGPIDATAPSPQEPLFRGRALDETLSFRGTEIGRTVVVLDGWDEVTITGSTRFKEQLNEWLPRVRQLFTDRPGPPVRLVVTGRPSPLVERSGLLRRETPVLTIRPTRPDQLRTYAATISSHLDRATRADWTLDLASCERAFQGYQTWFDRQGAADTPPLPGSGSAHRARPTETDVLGSPLLALLAFRTVAEWPGETNDLFEQPSALYNALVEVTATHAGKATDTPQGTVHRGGRSLRRLLQRVAAVITCQGAESVSFAELEARLEDDDSLTEWAKEATSDSTLHELLVNFYFKGHRDLGCEFLHKSFREYLYAEAIVAALEEIGLGRSGPLEPGRQVWGVDFVPGTVHHTASRKLAGLLGPVWLTPEVRKHVFWLIDRAAAVNREAWIWLRDLLNDIYCWWAEGSPVRARPVRRRSRTEWEPPLVTELIEDDLPRDGRVRETTLSTFDYDAHLGEVLIQLTAFVHALLHDSPMLEGARNRQIGCSGDVRFRPFDGEARQLIGRMSSDLNRPQGTGLAGAYLRRVDLSREDLIGCDFRDADLREALMYDIEGRQMVLTEADMMGTELANSNMMGANMIRARLTNSLFTGVDLTAALLVDADLCGADMEHARLLYAVVNQAKAVGTSFSRADLTGARLSGATLSHARFRHARVHSADLTSAELGRADLTGADLSGANLTRANLRHARLDNAKVGSADLTRAVLEGTILDRSDGIDAAPTTPSQA